MTARADVAPAGLVITCEHGGDRVPAEYAPTLAVWQRKLPMHRRYDPGALELARRFATARRAPLVCNTVTRLLVDLNRSLGHRALFSEVTSRWDDEAKRTVLDRHWRPYRERVETLLAESIACSGRVVHVSVHSFSPMLNGRRRQADVGLLYDPASPSERRFCRRWQAALTRLRPELRVRRNYPYRGTADGLVTFFRRRLGRADYIGIELEVSQRRVRGGQSAWRRLQRDLIESFSAQLTELHAG